MKKHPDEGSEIDLKPNAYKAVGAADMRKYGRRDSAFLCIMGQRVSVRGKLKPVGVGAAKASVPNRRSVAGGRPGNRSAI